MPWLLNLAYLAFVVLVSPVLLYRAVVLGKYRDGWRQKLWGQAPVRTGSQPCIWLHAVSVGEVLLLQPVVKELLSRRSYSSGDSIAAATDVSLYISTTTVTGYAVAREKFAAAGAVIFYCPLDFSWAVRRAIARIRPSLLVLVELELWPNLILAAHRAGVPLALVNGRISERSHRGYRRIRPLFAGLLNRIQILAVQNEDYARRLLDLGAASERVVVTGSVKFDHVQTDRKKPEVAAMRQAFGIADDETVFIAGSTQSPEEEYALNVWQQLAPQFPKLRLILVPRHRERFEEVARLVVDRGWKLVRRTAVRSGIPVPRRLSEEAPPVLLLDTLGELAHCWGLADIAFVGGSLTNRGGQNMIEPAGFGSAVLFGPNTQNFRDVVALLLSVGAARVVQNEHELKEVVAALLRDPAAAKEQGSLAQNLVLAQQGATKRTVDLLETIMDVPGRPNSAASPERKSAA